MKKLSNVLENKEDINVKQANIISLEGLDESEAQLLNNLDGMQINECCGCGCDSCCDCSITCMPGDEQICYLYSENAIIDRLKSQVTVQDLLKIENQFHKFDYASPELPICPLYFTEHISTDVMNQVGIRNEHYNTNKDLYNFILELCSTYKLSTPVCLSRVDGKIQLFFVKYTGTNGKEGSIKSSLSQIAKLLGEIEKNEKINWTQVLNVSIDNLDDTYAFLITMTCDALQFQQNLLN